MKDLTDNDFDQYVTNSQGPLVVDFYTPDCPPCKVLASILDELTPQSKATFHKVDASQWPETSARYRVNTVPTLIAFQGDQAIGQFGSKMAPFE